MKTKNLGRVLIKKLNEPTIRHKNEVNTISGHDDANWMTVPVKYLTKNELLNDQAKLKNLNVWQTSFS